MITTMEDLLRLDVDIINFRLENIFYYRLDLDTIRASGEYGYEEQA